MQASVQYDDFIGTAAADISDDYTILNKCLKARGVDIERYESIGAKFHAIYEECFSVSIICIDKQKTTDEKSHLVAIKLEQEFGNEDFFKLFKRFAMVIFRQGTSTAEITEEIDVNSLKTQK